LSCSKTFCTMLRTSLTSENLEEPADESLLSKVRRALR